LSSYILDFYYYYDGLEQPDIFTACGDDGSVLSFTNTDVNDGGLYNTTCYGVQFYYDFRSNLRNDKILSKFEVQLQKTTTTFPNEFRLYDFKIFSISCSPLPTPSPSPTPTEVPIVIESYDITSTNPLAVRISNQPSDNNSVSSGTTQYIARYNSDTSIQITAPLTGYFVDRNTFEAKQYTFNYWLLNNSGLPNYNNVQTLSVSTSDFQLSAFYNESAISPGTPPPPTIIINVKAFDLSSGNPLEAAVSCSPQDLNNTLVFVTENNLIYASSLISTAAITTDDGTYRDLTNGSLNPYTFQYWSLNGAIQYQKTIIVPLNQNSNLIAYYGTGTTPPSPPPTPSPPSTGLDVSCWPKYGKDLASPTLSLALTLSLLILK